MPRNPLLTIAVPENWDTLLGDPIAVGLSFWSPAWHVQCPGNVQVRERGEMVAECVSSFMPMSSDD